MQDSHLGSTLAAIAIFVGIVSATIAMAILGVPWWGCSIFGVWGALWLMAALGLSDEKSRDFLAGTLRESTFTQIYTTLARRNVMGIWTRLCDPVSNKASTPTLFRAALTWRLYDLALRLAVAYPLLLLIGQWVVTGAEGRVGSSVLLQAADSWLDQVSVMVIMLIMTCSEVGRKLALASQRPMVRKVAGWLFPIALALAAVVAVAVAGGLGIAVTIAVTCAFLVVIAFDGSDALADALAVAVAFAVVGAGDVAVAVAVAVTIAFVFAVAFAVYVLDRRERQGLARLLLTVGVVGALLIATTKLDWAAVPEDRRSLFLFLAVLPLLNALFDVVSYAVTLTLIRRGLRSALPFLWGLADLAVACVLLLGLGATLVAVIHGLNTLAGVPLLDLPALFEGVRAEPSAYIWLYLMLFSTLLPTLLHALLSLLGVQGIWPLKPRRRVAGWVDAASISPLHAIRASLGLSLIWAMPLLGLGAAFWALWHFGETALLRFLALYLDALVWIAGGAVGAI